MKYSTQSFIITALAPLVFSLASCSNLKVSSNDVQERATTTTRVDLKTVTLRVHTTGMSRSSSPVSSAEISAYGTSNTPGVKGFRLVFVPAGHSNLRPPYREGDHWVVLQQLESLDGWISALKDIAKNEGVAMFLFQTDDGAFTMTTLRTLTRK